MSRELTYYAIHYRNKGSDTVFAANITLPDYKGAIEFRDNAWNTRLNDPRYMNAECMWIDKVTMRTVGGMLA